MISQKVFHFRERWDAATGADLHALHGRDSMCEPDDVCEIPLLEHAINEGAVKDITGAGRIGDGNAESRGLHNLTMVHEQRALRPARDSNDRTAVAIGKPANGIVAVISGSKVGAGDEVVDEAKEFMRGVVIDFIDIDHDWDAGFTRPSRGLKRG